jgi:hypothetical protein
MFPHDKLVDWVQYKTTNRRFGGFYAVAVDRVVAIADSIIVRCPPYNPCASSVHQVHSRISHIHEGRVLAPHCGNELTRTMHNTISTITIKAYATSEFGQTYSVRKNL